MAAGTSTWEGMAVPLFGESEIQQVNSTLDMLTLTQVAANADFIVLRNSVSSEKFVVENDGSVTMAAGAYVNMGSVTTAPTTGLTAGDLFIALGSSTPQIGICYSTAGNSLRYITADTKTFGRTTG